MKIDKRDRARLFQMRLQDAMLSTSQSQAALARGVGADRSTISQLLNADTARLPNGQIVAEIARSLGVSSDWLLGLSDRPERTADVLASALAVTPAERSVVDAQILAWHDEARGYKIRHVPAVFPDLLATGELSSWEASRRSVGPADDTVAEDRLAWMETSGSDYEIALPLHVLTAMAHGTGWFEGMPVGTRFAQLDWMVHVIDRLYPRLRVYLYDAHVVYSAPLTIYGPLQAVIFLGRNYLAFRDAEQVAGFTGHFDWLVREAVVDARALPDWLRRLRPEIA